MDVSIKELLHDLDILSDKMACLEKEKREIYHKLSEKRKEIERNNSHLIGKRAMCTHVDNPRVSVECVCSAVACLDDYSGVLPLFSRNGKKYAILDYEWI